MKTILTLFAATLLICSVNSCSQCSECYKYPEPNVKLCKKDFASDESYAQAFRQTEGQGYDCK
ncbi:MAG: hypothetical protein KA149_06600 [Chitinophagales bacterium]|nr:hypothetical protein [Chitinophagales bacterium]